MFGDVQTNCVESPWSTKVEFKGQHEYTALSLSKHWALAVSVSKTESDRVDQERAVTERGGQVTMCKSLTKQLDVPISDWFAIPRDSSVKSMTFRGAFSARFPFFWTDMGEDDEDEAVGCGVCAGHGAEYGDMRA